MICKGLCILELRMNIALEKLLLSELRIVVFELAPGPASAGGTAEDASAPQVFSDDRIVKARTVNEELRNLG